MTSSTTPSTDGTPHPVDAVLRSARDLLESLPTLPKRLAVSAAGVTVEMEWTDTPGDPAARAPRPAERSDESRLEIRSPSVGTFYRAREPGAKPFVSEGDVIRPGQQVAIVEAMKLMLPVEADQAGQVTAVLKSDGEPVEYGEPLFVLRPAD